MPLCLTSVCVPCCSGTLMMALVLRAACRPICFVTSAPLCPPTTSPHGSSFPIFTDCGGLASQSLLVSPQLQASLYLPSPAVAHTTYIISRLTPTFTSTTTSTTTTTQAPLSSFLITPAYPLPPLFQNTPWIYCSSSLSLTSSLSRLLAAFSLPSNGSIQVT